MVNNGREKYICILFIYKYFVHIPVNIIFKNRYMLIVKYIYV